jgi:hypothetical protein
VVFQLSAPVLVGNAGLREVLVGILPCQDMAEYNSFAYSFLNI